MIPEQKLLGQSEIKSLVRIAELAVDVHDLEELQWPGTEHPTIRRTGGCEAESFGRLSPSSTRAPLRQ